MREQTGPGPRIAFVGLATSHPFTDVVALRSRNPSCEFLVWEPDPIRLGRFREQNPDASAVEGLDELIAATPDAVIVTVRPAAVAGLVERLLDAGIPVVVNKLAAVTAEQFAELDRVVSGREHLFLTSSVLRFSPALEGVVVSAAELLAVRVTVRHDVSWWIGGETAWQDDPVEGGGTVGIMGVHGFELLDVFIGPGFIVRWVQVSRRHLGDLVSEDVALIGLDWPDGLGATVEVLGHSQPEEYTVALHYAAGSSTVSLGSATPSDAGQIEDLGYAGLAGTVLAMASGEPSPVPWSRSRGVLRAVVDARAAAQPS